MLFRSAFTTGPQLWRLMMWRRLLIARGWRPARRSEISVRNCSPLCAQMRYSQNAIAHREAMITGDTLTLAGLFLLAAALYSSVGHAGASGYLAAMALVGMAPDGMRITALALNVVVATIGAVSYMRAGHFD